MKIRVCSHPQDGRKPLENGAFYCKVCERVIGPRLGLPVPPEMQPDRAYCPHPGTAPGATCGLCSRVNENYPAGSTGAGGL